MQTQRQRYKLFTVALQDELVAALDRAAREDDRTRQQQVRFLLRKALVERGLLSDAASAAQ
jgi:metal-responsive CopG/Arc/MetJ family transcriptional regulator